MIAPVVTAARSVPRAPRRSRVARQQARRLRGGGAGRAARVLRGGDSARTVADRTSHLAGGLVAIARVQSQRDRDRVRELGADSGHERVQGGRFLLLLLERQLGERGRLIRQSPGDQLVGDDSKRVQVGAGPRLLATRLLRREVRGGAENRADLGDARLLGRLGDAEVRQLDLAFASAQKVAGLDVAVDNAVAVRVVQALACLLR